MLGKLFRKLAGGGDKTPSTRESSAKPSTARQQDAPAKPSSSGAAVPKSPQKTQSKPRQQRAQRPVKPKPQPVAWDISEYDIPKVEGKTRFHDLNFPLEVVHAIADLGFEYASPIQAQSLPHTLRGQDLVGKAQTGTGKTAAFLLTIIDDLLRNPIEGERFAGEARALIIAPTRELVMQIGEDAKLLTKYTDLKIHTLVGGMDYNKQQLRLHDELVDILVATPGRLLDFCGNQDVFLDQIEIMVIDEADRMLDMGFIPQVRRIIRMTPNKEQRQTLLFSATFTPEVMTLAEQWTEDFVTVEIEPESVATDSVDQHVYLAATDEKYKLLYNILKQDDVDSLIVFANRRDECRRLHEKLERHGFKTGLLSGEIAQNKRVKTLDGFKSGEIKVLVATDVAGRGIHISGISHVVNFTLPEEPEDYVHRIGRTGRAGSTGTSISFACEDDAFRLEPIQAILGAELRCEQPPESMLVEPPPLGPRVSTGNEDWRPQGGRSNQRRHSNSSDSRRR